jgi:RNA polymerase sigma-70 factor (ECF subfamily)
MTNNTNLPSSDQLREFELTALIHTDELYATALRLTKNERDAEDLLQDTFLKAYTFFHRFEKNTNCRAWLFKILTNTFINTYRRKIKEREILGADDLRPVEENLINRDRIIALNNPERRLLRKLISEDVRAALEAIPLEFRMVVVLADLQEFSYKDIAFILGCPVGTVMSRLFRGRKLMRRQLADFAYEEGIIRNPDPYRNDATNRTRLSEDARRHHHPDPLQAA